jgi:hypothetical protein
MITTLTVEASNSSDWERVELELLFDIARTFDKHVELRTALGPLLSLLEIRAGLTWGMVTFLDRSSGLLKIEEVYGFSSEEKKRGLYRLGEGLVGLVFESGQAIMVPDISKETRFSTGQRTEPERIWWGSRITVCLSYQVAGLSVRLVQNAEFSLIPITRV